MTGKRTNSNFKNSNIRDLIYAGGHVKSIILVCSVFSAWMWTTSIIGSAETFNIYGSYGPLCYVVSACIGFCFFVWFMCAIERKSPGYVTYLDYVRQRFGRNTKAMFYIFSFTAPAYVLIEQAVGIAIVMNRFYGISFKATAFLSVIICVTFICLTGMKGLLKGEVIATIIAIGGIAALIIAFVLKNGSEAITANIAEGFKADAGLIGPVLRYFIIAFVIAFSQVVFDTGYYFKRKLARSEKAFVRTFVFTGAFLWGTVTLIIAYFAAAFIGPNQTDVLNVFLRMGAGVFTIIIIVVGMGTISHHLVGFLGLFATDVYESTLRPNATEKEKIVFGRVMTIAIGVFCGFVAISLENISLLTIDVFCAIFFAAPCGPLVLGLATKKKFRENSPIIAVIIGMIGGIAAWIYLPAVSQADQLMGVLTALILPIPVMYISSFGTDKAH